MTSQTTPAADTLQPAQPAATEPAPAQFTGAQMADLYNFPREYDGSGQCIGILELGDFRRQDVEALESQHRAFFDRYKLPMPKLTLVGLGTDSAASTLPSELEWKLGMDVQVIGAAAPGASLVMYFAPNTDDGYLSALKTAIDDRVNRPSVLYLGWGSPESSWSEQAMRLINAELQRAAEAGITVVVPAGDRGSSDGVDDKQPHVDFPASSPWVLACGATRLMFDQDGEISDEVVWNDGEELATGGGFSAVFSAPEWQEDAIDLSLASNANVRWRGVPDVAAHGAPSTYLVHIQDQEGALGGTSGAAAMWSALIARLNQALSAPVGHITPRLYEPKLRYSGVFREITQGNNGAYTAGPGWNACAGLGSVDGTRLLDALRSASSTLPA